MSIEDVIVEYKELDRNEVERRLAEAEVALSAIAADGWQTSPEVDNPDFSFLQDRARNYFNWVWKRKSERIRES